MLEATKLVEDTAASTVRARTWPTPIWVPKFVRNVLIVVTVPAVLAALVFVAWWVPSALFIVAGGFALATLLSTPVRTLSRIMPRRSRGLAVVVTFLVIVGLMVVGALFMVPRLMAQFATIADSLPALAESGRRYLLVALEQLDEWGLLAGTPEQTAPKIESDISESIGRLGGGLLGDPAALVSGAFGLAVDLFGIIFVAAYLLADSRRIKVTYLTAAPKRYRHDARGLWNAFEHSFSRYLSGLFLDLFIQGAVSALALYLLSVPYALALGAWVSLAALIPYFGSVLGAVPAVIVAFTVSPLTALLTVIAFFVIQQVEGNYLMPRIHGHALHMHPIPILLAVIVGWGLFGILGMVLAVPALAVVRVLYDFFSVRLRTRE
jgi:predicted PurR-regulated permease PerM